MSESTDDPRLPPVSGNPEDMAAWRKIESDKIKWHQDQVTIQARLVQCRTCQAPHAVTGDGSRLPITIHGTPERPLMTPHTPDCPDRGVNL